MSDEKDALPSDQEDGALKPRDPQRRNEGASSTPPPDDKKTEKDPSEQPS